MGRPTTVCESGGFQGDAMNALTRYLNGSSFPDTTGSGLFASALLTVLMVLLSSCASMDLQLTEIDADADKALLQLAEEVNGAEEILIENAIRGPAPAFVGEFARRHCRARWIEFAVLVLYLSRQTLVGQFQVP